MEVLRKIINGDEIPTSFGVPESFKKRKLEVIIIPLEEELANNVGLKRSGAFEAYRIPEMIEEEKNVWKIAMREKHDV